MATTVGSVEIDIRAKMDKLQADVTSGKNAMKRGMEDMQAAAKAMQGYIGMLGIDAFGGYIKSAIDAAGALADLAQKTGISAEVLSGLEYAAKMSGTSLDSVATGLKKLAANMYDTSKGTGDAKEAFKTLGISVVDATGKLRSTDGVMLDVADRFKAMDDGPKKAALAMKIFGKSGEELIPLLNEGSAGIEALRQRAEELGLTVSDETASAMEALGDKFDTVSMSSQGTARQIAASLTPAMSVLADMFLEGSKKGGFFTGVVEVLTYSFKVLASIAIGVASTFAVVGNAIGGVAAAAMAWKNEGGAAALRVLDDMKVKGEELAGYYNTKLAKIWEEPTKGIVKATTATTEHTAATKAQIAEADKQAKKISDVTGKLKDEMAMLKMTSVEADIYKQLKAAGVTANSAAGQEIVRLVTALDAEKQSTKLLAEAQAAAKKMTEEYTASNAKSYDQIVEAIAKENERIAGLGKTRTELAELSLAMAQKRLDDLYNNEGTEQDIAWQQARIAKWKEFVATVRNGEIADANIKAAEDSAKAWQKFGEDIEKALTDSLMRGLESGKSMWDSVHDYIVNGAKSMTVKFLVQPVMGAMNGMAGAFMGGGGGGSGSGMGSMLSGGKSLWDMAQGGLTGFGDTFAFGADSVGSWLMSNTTGAMNSFGGSLMSNAGAIGTGATWLGAGAAGIGIGSAIAGDMSVGGMNGTTASTIGTAIGAAVAGPIGAVVGGALGGAFNAAFGHGDREVLNTKLEGSIGGGKATGLQANSRWKEAGGWFTSDNYGNTMTGLGADAQKLMDAGATAILNSVKNLAQGLNLPVDQIAGITSSISIKLADKEAVTKEAVAKAIDDSLGAYQEALVQSYANALVPFRHENEKLLETFQRLSVIQTFSQTLNQFGGVFSAIASGSIAARESMIQLAGGIDALIAKSAAFVQSYYTANEQAGIGASSVLAALNAAGVTNAGALDSKADFRALVESIDVSTQAGREQVNALLDIAPQFAQLATTLESQDLSLTDLAALAPQIAALTPLFTTAADNQTAATVAAADATTTAINSTTSAVVAGNNAVVSAINGLAGTVANAVANAAAASNAAVSSMTSKLDAIEANARLARADTLSL